MRTLEYLAVTVLVFGLALWLSVAAATAISHSLTHSAAMITAQTR